MYSGTQQSNNNPSVYSQTIPNPKCFLAFLNLGTMFHLGKIEDKLFRIHALSANEIYITFSK